VRLKTLADVRKLIGRMPMDFRTKETWQRIAALVDDAARGDTDPAQLVLIMENVPVQPKKARGGCPVGVHCKAAVLRSVRPIIADHDRAAPPPLPADFY